jgi:hypothetical protein
MGLFDGGSAGSGEPWQVDVVTLEYVFSGTVDAAGQKWGWDYFQAAGGRGPARTFDLHVADARPTGTHPAPAVTGQVVSFSQRTAMVALVPRDAPAIAVWEKWNVMAPVAVELLLGPYALSGLVLSPDASPTTPILAASFGMRDVTLRRIDGAGDGAPLSLPRATVHSAFVHAASAPRG